MEPGPGEENSQLGDNTGGNTATMLLPVNNTKQHDICQHESSQVLRT